MRLFHDFFFFFNSLQLCCFYVVYVGVSSLSITAATFK